MRRVAMVLAASMMTLVDTAGAAAMPVALDAGNPAELGTTRGPGCRAHPESKWCARHYAQLQQRPAATRPVARHAARLGTRAETVAANRQFAPPPPPGYASPPPASYAPPPPPPPPSAYAAGAPFRRGGWVAGGRFAAALVALGLIALGVAAIAHDNRNDRPRSP